MVLTSGVKITTGVKINSELCMQLIREDLIEFKRTMHYNSKLKKISYHSTGAHCFSKISLEVDQLNLTNCGNPKTLSTISANHFLVAGSINGTRFVYNLIASRFK